jgi:hypothetical protein
VYLYLHFFSQVSFAHVVLGFVLIQAYLS